MTHAFYVIASYLMTGAICLGLTLWIYLDGRARRLELSRLEAQGIRRRSASVAGAPEAAGQQGGD